MKERLWHLLAWLVSRKWIANYLIERSFRTPYFHLHGYMGRFWLWNSFKSPKHNPRWPSVRIHNILRADRGRDLHDHPWDARTIILRGGYTEIRRAGVFNAFFNRERGDTATLNYGEFHRITAVDSNTWTMFITWNYQGKWGFWVGDHKVPHDEYEGEDP
jgi:hypothetical protein